VSVLVLRGDARALPLPDASVDAIVCDPPYGLGFMGKEWDSGKSFVERRAARGNTFDHVGGNHNPVDSADAARTRRVESARFGAWCQIWAAEALRVLKPGGHLLAFGGSRTWHRLRGDRGRRVRDPRLDRVAVRVGVPEVAGRVEGHRQAARRRRRSSCA
jgi:DNA modification methylase